MFCSLPIVLDPPWFALPIGPLHEYEYIDMLSCLIVPRDADIIVRNVNCCILLQHANDQLVFVTLTPADELPKSMDRIAEKIILKTDPIDIACEIKCIIRSDTFTKPFQ